MSVEFEKVVLEKLKVLDELNSKVNQLSEDMRETKEIVSNHTDLINNLSEKIEQLEEKVDSNTNLISSLSKKIDINTELIASLSKQVEQQGLNLASFENEFTIKVQALFDSFLSNTQSHLSYEKSIAILHSKTFKHDDRISALEDFYKGTKILASN